MIDYYEPKLDLTLLGCGYLGSYHMGALSLLSRVWPARPYNRISGASCGGLIAVMVAAGVAAERVFECLIKIPSFFERKLSGWWTISIADTISAVDLQLEAVLPEDAHLRCRDRCGLSLTQLWPFQNKFVSSFASRRELIEAAIAGCFIPMCMGKSFPKFRNKHSMDGAYSDNSPEFRLSARHRKLGYRRLRLSAFGSRELEIAPRDESSYSAGSCKVLGTKYLINVRNFVRGVYAMSLLPADYPRNFRSGFNDMKRFLLDFRPLLKCRQCHYQKFDTRKCLTCLRLLEKVDSLKVVKFEG